MSQKRNKIVLLIFAIAFILLMIAILFKLNQGEALFTRKREIVVDKCIKLATASHNPISYCLTKADKEVLLVSPKNYENNPLRPKQRFVLVADLTRFIPPSENFCIAIDRYNYLSDFYLKQGSLYKEYNTGQTLYLCSDEQRKLEKFSFTGIPKRKSAGSVFSLRFYSLVLPQPFKVEDLVSHLREMRPSMIFALPIISH